MRREGYRAVARAAMLVAGLSLQTGRASQPAEFLDDGPVLRLRLDLAPEAMEQLRSDPRGYVRGTIHEGDKTYPDVAVRLKGSIGSRRPLDDKPGFTLKFNRFIAKQRFHGLKKLILNNCVQDPSYVSDLLGNELFRAAGIPAPRVGFAVVEMNGRKLGLYAAAEAVTRDFLGRWFPDASGNVYEGPGDVNSERLGMVSNGGVAPRTELRALVDAAREKDLSKRLERLEKVLDVDRFISFVAMEAITFHWDGYTTGMNNYHLYHDPASGRLVFMPHGADQIFQNPAAPMTPQTSGLVARALLKTAKGRRRYRERLRELVEKVLDVERIQKRIAELEAKLRPVLIDRGPGALFSHASAIRGLSWRIAERAKNLREQLNGKVEVQGGPPLAFDGEGRARLAGWQPRIMGGMPEFARAQGEGDKGGAALRIKIPEGNECRASWRSKVWLSPGRYRLAGRIRTRGVEPAQAVFDDSPSGADLRISGDQPKSKLLQDHEWTKYEFEFDVDPEEEWPGAQPLTQVELICELQAGQGTAWFDERSLALLKLADVNPVAGKPEPPKSAPPAAPPPPR